MGPASYEGGGGGPKNLPLGGRCFVKAALESAIISIIMR
jgi:hypothetical protein